MKLGGNARFMTEVSDQESVQLVCKNAINRHIPFFVLGGGSNIIAQDSGYDI